MRPRQKIPLCLVSGFLLCGIVSSSEGQPRLSPSILAGPVEALVDQKVSLLVQGLTPKELVTVRATMIENQPSPWQATKDDQARIWQSWATFLTDGKGIVDLSRKAPMSGSYSDVDPMGLFWSMTVIGHQPSPSAADLLAPVEITFELEANGQSVFKTTVKRLFIAAGVKALEVRDNGLVGKLFEPEGKKSRPGVLVLGGSEGGLRSAELALLLASRFPELKAVVAYVPSHVVWQGIGFGSTWTFQGQPVPYVPFRPGAEATPLPRPTPGPEFSIF